MDQLPMPRAQNFPFSVWDPHSQPSCPRSPPAPIPFPSTSLNPTGSPFHILA
jgi:hypothetical protein